MFGHLSEVRDVAYSNTGDQIISAGNDNTVRLWRSSETEPNKLKTLSNQRSKFDRQGNLLKTLRGHGSQVHSCNFVGKRCNFAISSSFGVENQLKIWDLLSYAEQRVLDHKGPIGTASISPSGRYVATAGLKKQSSSNEIELFDLKCF